MMVLRAGRRRTHAREGLGRCSTVETGCEAACVDAERADEHMREVPETGEKSTKSWIGRRTRSP